MRTALRKLFAVIHRRDKMKAAGFQKALEAVRAQVMHKATMLHLCRSFTESFLSDCCCCTEV